MGSAVPNQSTTPIAEEMGNEQKPYLVEGDEQLSLSLSLSFPLAAILLPLAWIFRVSYDSWAEPVLVYPLRGFAALAPPKCLVGKVLGIVSGCFIVLSILCVVLGGFVTFVGSIICVVCFVWECGYVCSGGCITPWVSFP